MDVSNEIKSQDNQRSVGASDVVPVAVPVAVSVAE